MFEVGAYAAVVLNGAERQSPTAAPGVSRASSSPSPAQGALIVGANFQLCVGVAEPAPTTGASSATAATPRRAAGQRNRCIVISFVATERESRSPYSCRSPRPRRSYRGLDVQPLCSSQPPCTFPRRAAQATLTFARRLARTRRRGERVGRLGWERSRAQDAAPADPELLPQLAERQAVHRRRRVLPRQGAVACEPATVRAPGELPVAPPTAATVHPRQPRSRPVRTPTVPRNDGAAGSRRPRERRLAGGRPAPQQHDRPHPLVAGLGRGVPQRADGVRDVGVE